MEASLVRACEDFSIQGYEDWSFRIKICLQAHHYLMWDVIENGPSPILGKKLEITRTSPGKPTYKQKPKDPHDYTSEERKIVGLNNFAKCLISSMVKGVYLAKIRSLNTAKEIWDTLKAVSQGSEEMLENKLSMACNKLDDFKMLYGKTI